MPNPDWTKEFPGMISVCDAEGKILSLNDRETDFFKAQGGSDLVGTSLYACHNPASNQIIKKITKTQEARAYIAEENGQRELVIQSPWFQDGKYAGLVEISIEIHGDLPLIIRK